MKLSDEKKIGLFKSLASESLYDVGIKYGFDKYYSTPASIRGSVYKVYREVANHPDMYGISQDTVDLVETTMKGRNSAPRSKPSLKEQEEMQLEMKDALTQTRDLSHKLVFKKLQYLDNNPKALRNMSLPQMATTFAILFDKSQIIKGQATEHIAVMGKIDSDMKPEEALDAVIKMREVEQAKKGKS